MTAPTGRHPARPAAAAHTEPLVVPAVRTATLPSAVARRRLVAPRPSSPGHAEPTAAASPEGAPPLPVVRIEPVRDDSRPAWLTPWAPGLPPGAATVLAAPWASLPGAPEQNGRLNGTSAPPAAPVVHERLVSGQAAPLGPAPGERATLPLAAATALAGTATAARPPALERTSRTGGHPQLASRGLVRMPTPTAASETSHGSEPQRAAPARIDVDRIVDQVQRKLMQRLTIAGERRGLRP